MTDQDRPNDETQAWTPDDDDEQAPDDATRQMDVPAADEPEPTHVVSPPSSPASPTTEHIAIPAASPGIAPWLIATVVVIALIAGAVLGYNQRRPSDRNVLRRALVGPDGGVLEFDGRGRLEIPRGALPTATSISIRRETLDRRVRLGPEGDPRTVVYEPGELVVYVFQPTTLRFQQPVKITLPASAQAAGILVDSDIDPRVIAGDQGDGVVTFETTSFDFRPS